MLRNIIGWSFVVFYIWLILHCPILKPWFGFKRPKNPLPDHRWFK